MGRRCHQCNAKQDPAGRRRAFQTCAECGHVSNYSSSRAAYIEAQASLIDMRLNLEKEARGGGAKERTGAGSDPVLADRDLGDPED